MTSVDRKSLAGEQLVVLWTWLLEGYVPVPHTVADLDELEATASSERTDTHGAELPAVGDRPDRCAA